MKARVPRGRRAVAFATVLALLSSASGVFAYWGSTGQVSASAGLATLPAPAITTATAGAEVVKLAWSTVGAPGSGAVEYYVTRDGGAPSSGCPGSSSHSTVTSCTDTGASIGTHEYTVTAVWRSWTATSTVSSVTVASGPATHLQLEAASTTPNAGEADNLTITAKDASNRTVSSYSGSHSLVFEGASEALTGTNPVVIDNAGAERKLGEATELTFTEGKVTVSASENGVMKLYRAEEAHITVKEGSLISGSGLAVTVEPAAFKTFHVTASPGEPEAGAAFEARIVAWDEWHNPITTYARAKKLHYEGAEASPSGKAPEYSATTEPTFSGGEASVAGFKLYKAAATTLKIVEEESGHEGAASFTVKAASATKKLSVPTPGEQTAGVAFNVTLTATDEWGNKTTAYSGSKTLTWSGPANAPSGQAPSYPSTATTVTFTGGEGTASAITLFDAQSTTLTAKEGTTEGTSGSFTVKAAGANSFSVPTPSEQTAGSAFNVSVTAWDTWHNTAKGYVGSKTLAWSGPANAPSGTTPEYPASATTVTFAEGVGTASSIKLYDAQSTTLKAKEGAIEGTSGSFTVKAGATKKFTVATPSEQTAATAFNVALTATDEWANKTTSYAGSKTLAWSGPASSPSAHAPSYPSTATTVTFTAGEGTATSITLYDAQSTTLTAKEGAIEGTSGSFTVKATTAKRLAWTGATVSAGTLSSPCLFTCEDATLENSHTFKAKVSVTDEYGNIVTALGTGHTVALTTTAGTLSISELTIASSGNATSTSEFPFTSQASGNGTDTLKAKTKASTVYTEAEVKLHY